MRWSGQNVGGRLVIRHARLSSLGAVTMVRFGMWEMWLRGRVPEEPAPCGLVSSELEEVVCRLHAVAWGGGVAFGDLRSCTDRDGQIGSSRYARWEGCCCLDVRARAQIFRTRFSPEPNVRYCPRVQCSRQQTAGLLIPSKSLIDPTVSINYLSRATPYQSNGRSKVDWGC